jgi:predicted metal-dependent enzyme (double-stranded beta helix superfamily)
MTDAQSNFDLDDLVNRLCDAARGEAPRPTIKDILQGAVEDPRHMRDGMPAFEDDDTILFEDESVSIWHCRFRPGYTAPPHDHQMSAIIGVYKGAERNDFFENDLHRGIRKCSEVELAAGNFLEIGPSAIHAVRCASDAPSCGIHVYLGELTNVDRSLFNTDENKVLKFNEANYQGLISTK